MPKSLGDIDQNFAELESRFEQLKDFNQLLINQAKEYFLLNDSVKKLQVKGDSVQLYLSLDDVLMNNFEIDEYALFLKTQNSPTLFIVHSMGIPKYNLNDFVYRPGEGIVGRVFDEKQEYLVPNAQKIENLDYFGSSTDLTGCIFYLPLSIDFETCLGVLKMRKIIPDSFTPLQMDVLKHFQKELALAILSVRKIETHSNHTFIDSKTGLYNHQYLETYFPVEFKRAQRYRHNFSVIYLAIENFQVIVNQFPEEFTDQVLKNLGDSLNNYTRSSDLCIRNSVSDFFILLPEAHPDAALTVADKLQNIIENMEFRQKDEGGSTGIQVSNGIASYPQDTIEPEQLLTLAKDAAKKPKRLSVLG